MSASEHVTVQVVRLEQGSRGHVVRVISSGVAYLDPEEAAELSEQLLRAADDAVNAARAERR